MSARVPEPLDAAEYARQVRAALADLPAGPQQDLLEDLDDHLAEIVADGAGRLEDELGPPVAYARELRRAAGLATAAPSSPGPSPADRIQESVRRLARRHETQAVLAFLPELRPGWWVLRAWLAAGALSYLAGSPSFLLPFGPLLGLPVLAAAIVLSVRLGRWTQARPRLDPRGRLVAIGSNVALALFALFVLIAVQQQDTRTVYADTGPYGYGQGGTLTRQDGTPITNIYPYSTTGQPLTDVLLYDQDGQALDNVSTTATDGTTLVRVVPPGSPPRPANAYPQQQQARSPYDEGIDPSPPPQSPSPPTAPPVSPSSGAASPPAATTAPPTTHTPTPAPSTTAPPSGPAVPTPDGSSPVAPNPVVPSPTATG